MKSAVSLATLIVLIFLGLLIYQRSRISVDNNMEVDTPPELIEENSQATSTDDVSTSTPTTVETDII